MVVQAIFPRCPHGFISKQSAYEWIGKLYFSFTALRFECKLTNVRVLQYCESELFNSLDCLFWLKGSLHMDVAIGQKWPASKRGNSCQYKSRDFFRHSYLLLLRTLYNLAKKWNWSFPMLLWEISWNEFGSTWFASRIWRNDRHPIVTANSARTDHIMPLCARRWGLFSMAIEAGMWEFNFMLWIIYWSDSSMEGKFYNWRVAVWIISLSFSCSRLRFRRTPKNTLHRH